MSKLPFAGRIFWKVLLVVAVLVVLTFFILIRFTDYKRTTTDTVGATITGVIFSYLVHLWLLPAEYLHGDEPEEIQEAQSTADDPEPGGDDQPLLENTPAGEDPGKPA